MSDDLFGFGGGQEASEEWLYGLADKDGVEALEINTGETFGSSLYRTTKEVNTEQFSMCIRATANTQKSAVVFNVMLDFDDATEALKLLKNKQSKECFQYIKAKAKRLQLSTYGTTKVAAKKNWDAIVANLIA